MKDVIELVLRELRAFEGHLARKGTHDRERTRPSARVRGRVRVRGRGRVRGGGITSWRHTPFPIPLQ